MKISDLMETLGELQGVHGDIELANELKVSIFSYETFEGEYKTTVIVQPKLNWNLENAPITTS